MHLGLCRVGGDATFSALTGDLGPAASSSGFAFLMTGFPKKDDIDFCPLVGPLRRMLGGAMLASPSKQQ